MEQLHTPDIQRDSRRQTPPHHLPFSRPHLRYKGVRCGRHCLCDLTDLHSAGTGRSAASRARQAAPWCRSWVHKPVQHVSWTWMLGWMTLPIMCLACSCPVAEPDDATVPQCPYCGGRSVVIGPRVVP